MIAHAVRGTATRKVAHEPMKTFDRRNLADSQMTFICPGRRPGALACSAAGSPPCR